MTCLAFALRMMRLLPAVPIQGRKFAPGAPRALKIHAPVPEPNLPEYVPFAAVVRVNIVDCQKELGLRHDETQDFKENPFNGKTSTRGNH